MSVCKNVCRLAVLTIRSSKVSGGICVATEICLHFSKKLQIVLKLWVLRLGNDAQILARVAALICHALERDDARLAESNTQYVDLRRRL